MTRTNPLLDKSGWEKDERGYVRGDKTTRGDMSRVAKLRRGYVRVAKKTEGDLSGRGFVHNHITHYHFRTGGILVDLLPSSAGAPNWPPHPLPASRPADEPDMAVGLAALQPS